MAESLGQRLAEILRGASERRGFPFPADAALLATCDVTTFVPCGRGVVSFTPRAWTTYLNAGFPPGDTVGYLQAYRAIRAGVERYGKLTAVVHIKNQPSARLVVRLGGVPIGLDPEGFIHYDIVHGRTTHAKPASTPGSPPDF